MQPAGPAVVGGQRVRASRLTPDGRAGVLTPRPFSYALEPSELNTGLVRGVDQNSHRAAIPSELLKLAKDFGVAVIAEGVETEEPLLFLGLDADFAQGYFFARPAFLPPTLASAYTREPERTRQSPHNPDAARA